MTKTFAAFMSYVRMDDQHENGRLTELCSRLAGEVRMQLGQEFLIFQDRNDISWGEQWKQRIDGTIDATTFLIPIITPSFFKSSACRGEVERFLEREKRLERSDLIMPLYYVNCPILGDEISRRGMRLPRLLLLGNMLTGESFGLSRSQTLLSANCWPDLPARLSGHSTGHPPNAPPKSPTAWRTNLRTGAKSNRSLLLRRRCSEQVRAGMNPQPSLWTHYTVAIIPV
jgi:TIR domain